MLSHIFHAKGRYRARKKRDESQIFWRWNMRIVIASTVRRNEKGKIFELITGKMWEIGNPTLFFLNESIFSASEETCVHASQRDFLFLFSRYAGKRKKPKIDAFFRSSIKFDRTGKEEEGGGKTKQNLIFGEKVLHDRNFLKVWRKYTLSDILKGKKNTHIFFWKGKVVLKWRFASYRAQKSRGKTGFTPIPKNLQHGTFSLARAHKFSFSLSFRSSFFSWQQSLVAGGTIKKK